MNGHACILCMSVYYQILEARRRIHDRVQDSGAEQCLESW